MAKFIGRLDELALLDRLLDKSTSSLVVLSGRRRIGKSRLVEEFADGHRFISFTGLPPRAGSTMQSQLNEFMTQMERKLQVKHATVNDWGEAFHNLEKLVKKNRAIILFDEISWMGSHDPDFLGKLKNAWDDEFKKNDKLGYHPHRWQN